MIIPVNAVTIITVINYCLSKGVTNMMRILYILSSDGHFQCLPS